jgi:hypothetical protein
MNRLIWALIAIALFLMCWTQKDLNDAVRTQSRIVAEHEVDIRAIQLDLNSRHITRIPNAKPSDVAPLIEEF